MINHKDKKLILLPPKTGTSSLESLFTKNFCGYSAYTRYHPLRHIHMYLDESIFAYGIKDIENWEIYQTARNPMDRIISAFLHQKFILRELGKKMKILEFEDFVETVNQHHHLLPEKERTFSSSVLCNDKIIPSNNKCSAGVRFYVPQTTWADPSKYNVKYIKLGQDNSKLYAEMGLPSNLKLPHLNKSRLDKSRHQNIHTYRTKEIIQSLYKNDFLKLNYE